MKTKKYFMIPFLALLACGCQDEEGGTVSLATGEEVKFSGALPTTRTIYGPLTDGAYPIYWVNGDEVIVSSPDCAESGYASATYRVSVEGDTQNYATSLDKTGEIGVRWGDAEQATFYSVYPADAERTTLGSDLKTVTLSMPVQQDNNIVEKNGQEIARPDMKSCFMYAKTDDVKSGEVVNLRYIPLTTALRFTLHGPTTGDPVTVNFVRIFAPEGTNLTGTITADLSTATESQLPTMRVINSRNYVTMNAAYSGGRYLTLGPNESMELNAFLTITENTTITDEWYIEIGTSLGNSYKLPLKSVSDQKTLVPGMVHNLGDVPPFNFDEEWDPSNWMANLQRNVYLSEISIPGSWYSLHNAYQGARNSIQAQYNAGVRAFHLDTRWRGTKRLIGGLDEVVDLGVLDDDDHSFREGIGGAYGDRYLTTDAPSFTDALTQITNLLKREDGSIKKDEYMVVICTFAQDSGNPDGMDWRQAVSDACSNNDLVINASSLSENTVVADVLGKVIVIINTFSEVNFSGSKCLFFNMGISLQESDWTGVTTDSEKYYEVPLQYGDGTDTDITIYGTHAQATKSGQSVYDNGRGTWVPSYSDREAMAQNILNWSKDNYSDIENYAHDAWMYIGLGGYVPSDYASGWDDEYTPVSDALNPWINSIVTGMDVDNSYYPVGIVLMNFAANYSYVLNNILMLNNKYRKAYDPNRSPVDGKPVDGGTNSVQSAAPGYSSGMTDNGANAIGWSRIR